MSLPKEHTAETKRLLKKVSKDKIAKELPGVPVDAIEMRMYGRMDGKGALAFAKSLMKD